ncbi:MAG: hypothetical protein KatS3mg110_3042 [Pirellulaceae bacterium]|nr:MAG: hypothetical protein KatS3mg110_3042 [Pirellulaceae bacterium]
MMLAAGRSKVRTCQGWTRRELLRAGLWSVLPWSLAQWSRLWAVQQQVERPKAAILLWLWGGPSHLESFDPKPSAPVEYRGPFSTIPTAIPGVRFCELLPRLAARSHRVSIIRSLCHDSNDHGIAGTISLTGSNRGAVSLGGQTLPGQRLGTHGSVATRVWGFRPGLPQFVTIGGRLHQGKKSITGEDGGLLGALYDPFRMDYHPQRGVELPALTLHDGISPSGLEARDALRRRLNLLSRTCEQQGQLQQMNQYFEQAYGLLTSAQARQVFDVEQEPAAIREQYGRHRFGQCCLLARRLVEAGVRFVQVNWSSHVEPIEDTGDGGWDMHDRYFRQFQDRHSWMLDQALAALLDDLDQRGLLEQTVVVAVGEFGRTPKINEKSGRDHWNQCYCGLVAGGGFPQGIVVGASDARAEYPVDRPVSPADLFTTVFHHLGITTPRLTAVGLQPVGQLIEELL